MPEALIELTADFIPGKTPVLTPELQQQAASWRERLAQAAGSHFAVFAARSDLDAVLALSEFAAKTMVQFPEACARLIEAGALNSDAYIDRIESLVKAEIIPGLTDPELKKRIRRLRRTLMLIIAWRDLTGLASVNETLKALSSLAECMILQTMHTVREALSKIYGEARTKDGAVMPLLILGMGKLGGRELNFSSDLDLIFAYPYDGQTDGAQRAISHQEFFTKIIQRFCNLMLTVTAEGFGYRIDLRLRPFGNAGPIVSDFDALSNYYETQGRTWERYALVKARILGHEEALEPFASELYELLQPFVYRRYLDYSAIESLRKLKHMIEAEVRRKRLSGNFKLGMGGIREVEFIVQVFELMRGGRIPELRERSLRLTLKHLANLQLLPSEVCSHLDYCYAFLRRLENAVQEINDQQSQMLPAAALDQMRIALAMNCQSWQECLSKIDQVMQLVHTEFCKVMRDDRRHQTEREEAAPWEANLTEEEFADLAEPLMRHPEQKLELARGIMTLRQTLARMPVGPVGRETLAVLMPRLVRLAAVHEHAPELFAKLGRLIEKIALRTTYLQLLNENINVCRRVVSLLNENEFAGELICAHPILLDELIAPQYFSAPPKPEQFLAWLRERMLRIEPDDLEGQMEELRLYKKIMVLRIAMSDRSERLPLMKVSDCLSFLAEALIREMIVLAWNQISIRYGTPPGRSAANPGIAVIGYGKLGGIELGYKSDLDMVFIRADSEALTEGDNPVPVSLFYQKLVQRIMHLSTTRMTGGVLYELDMRLRPDGDAGVLVADAAGFDAYEKNRAWTWEHQALVRARPVAGSADVIAAFGHTRDQVLRRKRDAAKLKQDVIEMRDKMRRHLDRSSDKLFDLKQGRGGMVDIEFIAQYLLLRESAGHADMILWSDNVRIFDECARLKIMSEQDAATLKQAYLAIRGFYHRLSLADLPRLVAVEDKPEQCREVERIWRQIFEA